MSVTRKVAKGGPRAAKKARRHAHAHPHAHDAPPHGHDHEHDHDHDHVADGDPEAHRQPLPAGAGVGKILFFDAFSGLAGDMTVAALVDLGVPFEVVDRAVQALGVTGARLRIERVWAGAIGATRFHVEAKGRQPERRYREIDRLLRASRLEPGTQHLARAIFRKLGEAEARVHRIPIEEVQFHEVGAVDALADIVGAAACLMHLGAEIVCAPLPLGRGFVQSRHGTIPLPAPATVECLRGVPTVASGLAAELVTPTGAAIVASVARRFASWPALSPERVGWGAGTASLPDRPNALRVVLGSHGEEEAPTAGSGTHVVVEANLDDATGELVGHAIAVLLAEGALDAWVTTATTKKGRPGFVLSALARLADGHRLAEVVLRETPSIGVRLSPVTRIERPRSVERVKTRFGPISVKVSAGPHGPPVAKPEFDECVRAARRAGVPVRVVIDEAARAVGSVGSLER